MVRVVIVAGEVTGQRLKEEVKKLLSVGGGFGRYGVLRSSGRCLRSIPFVGMSLPFPRHCRLLPAPPGCPERSLCLMISGAPSCSVLLQSS